MNNHLPKKIKKEKHCVDLGSFTGKIMSGSNKSNVGHALTLNVFPLHDGGPFLSGEESEANTVRVGGKDHGSVVLLKVSAKYRWTPD